MGRRVRLLGRAFAEATLFVDTSVWSHALRRDTDPQTAEVQALLLALHEGRIIVTTGLVLQELLQGFSGPKARRNIIERFASSPTLTPDRDDHVEAAELRNGCRRSGARTGTIDALLARLCIRHEMTLLTSDRDFVHAAAHCPLKVWTARA